MKRLQNIIGATLLTTVITCCTPEKQSLKEINLESKFGLPYAIDSVDSKLLVSLRVPVQSGFDSIDAVSTFELDEHSMFTYNILKSNVNDGNDHSMMMYGFQDENTFKIISLYLDGYKFTRRYDSKN